MKNMNFAAVAALAAFALVACDNTQFNPEGDWLFNESGYEGTSTYLNAEHNVSEEYTMEEIMGGAMPVPMPIAFEYDAASETLTISGSDYPVVDRVAEVNTMQAVMMVPGFNCEVTEYQSIKIHFDNAAGSEGRIRIAEGFKLRDTAATNNCTQALMPAKLSLLSGDPVPSDLQSANALGLIKAAVLDQLRSFEVAQVVSGENTSASPALDGGVTESMTATQNAEVSALVSRVLAALIQL